VVDCKRKFGRQHPIDDLIADSFYPSEKLIIELYRNPQKSTTPAGMRICIIIKKWSGHPSFKRRGNISYI
jgi:hypothetical protein